jgi:hypothetical protein
MLLLYYLFLGISLVIDPATEYLGNPEFCGLHVVMCYPLFQINKVKIPTYRFFSRKFCKFL